MNRSRRRFLDASVKLAGLAMLPAALTGSCIPWKKGPETVIDYIGKDEEFEKYRYYFKKLNGMKIFPGSLEKSLESKSDIVLLDTNAPTKSSYIILLLEKGKDILTIFPLGGNLSEYASISEFMEKYGRIVGLLNPLMFYPSIRKLREIIYTKRILLSRISINSHPLELGRGFHIPGSSGTAQPLQRMVSYVSDSYPLSLLAGTDERNHLGSIHLMFRDFVTEIRFNPDQVGWNMELAGAEFTGNDFTAISDHTGLLTVNNEVEPRLAPDPAVLEDSIRANLEDFIKAVHERTEPRVNHIDGLASIVLNIAVGESLKTGNSADL